MNILTFLLMSTFTAKTGATIIGALDSITYDFCKNVTISEKEIWEFISKNYSTKHRPVKDATKPIFITTSIVLERLSDIVEKERLIIFLGYLILQWYDEYLPWNDVAPYNCVEKILIPHTEVWNPDLVLMGSEDKYSLMHAPGHFVELSQTGGVTFYPGGEIRTECDLDLRYFPFDQQWCNIQFGGWYMWDGKQTLQLDPGAPIGFMNFAEGEQWTLVNYSARANTVLYPSDPREWTKVEFTFHFRRKSMYYLVNIITPCTVISVVEIVIFALPVDKVVKVHISFTSLLAYGVFQLMIIEDIPRASENTPFLSIYIDLEMIYIGVILMAEGLNFVYMGRMHGKRPPPRWMFEFLKIVGQIVFFGDLSSTGIDVDKIEAEWQLYDAIVRREKIEGEFNEDGLEDTNDSKLFPAEKYAGAVFGSELFNLKKQKSTHVNNKFVLTNDFESDAMEVLNHKFAQHKPRDFMDLTWLLMAKINSRVFVALYTTAITLTPLLFFVIIPAISPQQIYTPKLIHTA